MHLTILRENLIAVLSRAAITSTTKTTIPVLSCALFNAADTLTVSATDLEQYVTTKTESEIIERGAVLIPVQQALSVAKQLPKGAEVSIKSDAQSITIRHGRYHTTIQALPVEDFPQWAESDFTVSINIPADVLSSRLQAVAFAQSTEETRYYLCGVYIHQDDTKLKFVATDGHRLGLTRVLDADITGDLSSGAIIPRRTIGDILKALSGSDNVVMSVGQSRIRFDLGDTQIESKLVEGSFPDYQRVIPKANNRIVTVNARELMGAVERVSAVSKDRSRPVRVSMTEDMVSLECRDPSGDMAEDQIDVSYSGDDFSICIQARYMQDVLTQIRGDAICCFADESSPVVVKDSANEDFVSVIMPMRV